MTKKISIHLFPLAFAICISISLHGCCGHDEGSIYLSDSILSWTSFANSQVIFRNENSDTSKFTYSIPHLAMNCTTDLGPCSKNDPCSEHHFEIQSSLMWFSSSALNHGIEIFLSASIPGPYAHETLFVGNFQLYFVNGELDTANDYYPLAYTHLSEIELNGTIFHDIYRNADTSYGKTYFNKELGIVGFITQDSTIWSLQQ